MATTKERKAFRLSAEAIDALARSAENQGVTATEIVERAILAYGGDNAGGATESRSDGRFWEEQLQAKDEQISALTAALATSQEISRAAQETAKAAQVLQASEKSLNDPAFLGDGQNGQRDRRLSWRERLTGQLLD